MAEPTPADPSRRRRERWIVAALVTALVLARSAVFLVWPQAHFDSDQGVMGLMAKHLSEGRAFPMFLYGQNYILAVEAWLAAPVFLVAGVSVATLRFPLLLVNVAVSLLLLRIFERDVGLKPRLALVPTLFFALTPPGTTSHLLQASGGNVEAFLYVLLLWLTRHRPNLGGVILGIGFLHREFTIYGFLSLLAIEAMRRTLFTRDGLRRRFVMLRAAAEVWLVVQFLKGYSSAAGPGTTLGDVFGPRDNVLELGQRICWSLSAIPAGAWRVATEHWPALFGVAPMPLGDFGIDSAGWQGLRGAWLLLAAVAIAAMVRVAWRTAVARGWPPACDPCAYLVLAGSLSVWGYVLARCGQVEIVLMRYELLSVLAASGLAAWFLRLEPWAPLRQAWTSLAVAWVAIMAVPDARLLAEYVTHPPAGAKQVIIRNLEARGARYAVADYWLAYSITFLTNERIIAASSDFVRIQEYQRTVEAHRAEAVTVSRRPCPDGREVVRGVYFCGQP
jgi:hypothetical protein